MQSQSSTRMSVDVIERQVLPEGGKGEGARGGGGGDEGGGGERVRATISTQNYIERGEVRVCGQCSAHHHRTDTATDAVFIVQCRMKTCVEKYRVCAKIISRNKNSQIHVRTCNTAFLPMSIAVSGSYIASVTTFARITTMITASNFHPKEREGINR